MAGAVESLDPVFVRKLVLERRRISRKKLIFISRALSLGRGRIMALEPQDVLRNVVL